MAASFAGPRMGKNKASPQLNAKTQGKTKDAKNYSLQLNQVVKKILGDQQTSQ
jgi:hypothetical protein